MSSKNVIILATSISTRSDGKLMDIGLESGNGYYVSMGKAQPITWSKDSDDSPIKLFMTNPEMKFLSMPEKAI